MHVAVALEFFLNNANGPSSHHTKFENFPVYYGFYKTITAVAIATCLEGFSVLAPIMQLVYTVTRPVEVLVLYNL